jgi:AcrR family transcriptional regulator
VPAQAKTREAVRRARTEAYRGLILDAALQVFAARGYRDAKVQEIAEQAGVATGTVYGIFPSKQELYRAVHETNLDDLASRYREFSVSGFGTQHILLERTRIAIEFLCARPSYLRIYLQESNQWGLDPVDLPPLATAFMDLDLYRYGVEAGELIDEDPEVLQGMAMSISRVVLFHWLRGDMKETPSELVERIQAHSIRAFFR